MTITTADNPQPIPTSRSGRLVRDSAYVLLGFPIAILALSGLLTGLSVGISLGLLLVGVPVLLATLTLARRLAAIERRRIASVIGRSVPPPAHPQVRADLPAQERIRAQLRDRQSWRDLTHGMLRVLPSTAAFTVVVTWWTGAVTGLTAPVWDHWISADSGAFTLAEALGFADEPAARIGVNFLLGIAFLLTLSPVVHACAWVEAAVALRFIGAESRLRPRQTAEVAHVVDVERGVYLLNR